MEKCYDLYLSCTLTMFNTMKNLWSQGRSFPHLPITKSTVASTKAPAVTSTITSWCLRYIDAFSKLKRGNVCSQREVGNSNIQITAELNVTDISGLQSFIPVNDVFISICRIIRDLFLPITGIIIAGWKEK